MTGSCDICDRQHVPLYRGVVCGIETFYCDRCAGHDELADGGDDNELGA